MKNCSQFYFVRSLVFLLALLTYVNVSCAEPEARKCLELVVKPPSQLLFPIFKNQCSTPINYLYCCTGDDPYLSCNNKAWGASIAKANDRDTFFGCKNMANLAFDACFDPHWPSQKGATVIGSKMAATCYSPTFYRPEIVKHYQKSKAAIAAESPVVKKLKGANVSDNPILSKKSIPANSNSSLRPQRQAIACSNPFGGPTVPSNKFVCGAQGFIWHCGCSGGSCNLSNTQSQACTAPGNIID